MDNAERAAQLHKEHHGKFATANKIPIKDEDDLSLVYTPGVAEPCRRIAKRTSDVYEYTSKGNMVAVVSDGSAVLGLGNIGPEAAIPVMEGKAALFKQFGGVDAIPLCLDTQDADEIVDIVAALAPSFGGINLEDISAPRCFEVERALKERLDIPVFHDDQHGTAIVVAAGLLNALKLVGKELSSCSIVINGAGAAGLAITNLLSDMGATDIVVADSKGAIYDGREGLNTYKQEIAGRTNAQKKSGSIKQIIAGADVFIGVSVGDLLDADDISSMEEDAIVFAMANPQPEILPREAKKGGARIVATGRSDFPNQINNVLVFPGLFRGLLDARANNISSEMKIAAAHALAECVDDVHEDRIIPSSMDSSVAKAVAKAVSEHV